VGEEFGSAWRVLFSFFSGKKKKKKGRGKARTMKGEEEKKDAFTFLLYTRPVSKRKGGRRKKRKLKPQFPH